MRRSSKLTVESSMQRYDYTTMCVDRCEGAMTMLINGLHP